MTGMSAETLSALLPLVAIIPLLLAGVAAVIPWAPVRVALSWHPGGVSHGVRAVARVMDCAIGPTSARSRAAWPSPSSPTAFPC